MRNYALIFITSIFLSFITRFYLLGEVPAGLYLDEAAQGYNAYSILMTGKDEFGMPFPAAFRSFVDFKTPVYIYLIAPLIPLFGLTAFAVRFPSALASVLTLPVLYLLIKKLTPNPKQGLFLATVSSLLLSISPWHILFGRTNFECNVALFFFLSGIYLFYLGIQKPVILVLSATILAIALPSYHSERILVPIVVIYLAIRYHKVVFGQKHRLYTIIGLLIGLFISIPTISILNTPGFLSRFNTLTLNTESTVGFISGVPNGPSNLVNSVIYLRVKDFLSLYLSYFSPRNLFFLGDYGGRSSFPGLSTFFIWQLPFYFHGLYLLLKKNNYGNLKEFVLLLLLISPIPAALTKDPFSTIRALPLVIPITLLISISAYDIWQRIKDNKSKIVYILSAILLIFYSMARLTSSVIYLNEYFRATFWEYGWEQVVDIIKTKTDPDLPITVDSSRGEQYSQILFYTAHDPATYQRENFEVNNKDYYTNLKRNQVKKIGRITVRGISWEEDTNTSQYLVGDYLAISEEQLIRNHLEQIGLVKYPDGSPAFRVVKTHPELNSVTIK